MRLTAPVAFLWGMLSLMSCWTSVPLPDALDPRTGTAPDALEARIEAHPVCVGSSVDSAGELGKVLYYRSAWLPDGRLVVGYYAFFSEERPWGNNWLTWTVIPALAVDLVYTRLLMVGPGYQRLAYGKGDVEGFRVIYRVEDDGSLEAESAVADDGNHDVAHLDRGDLYATDPERLTVYSDAWSHQLGGRGATSPDELSYRTCYGPSSMRPLTAQIARDFELEGRASPADVGPSSPEPAFVAAGMLSLPGLD